jgi:hypothetical protein
MKTLLSFNDAGASDDEPVKGIIQADIRAWHDAESHLLLSVIKNAIEISKARTQMSDMQSETLRLEEVVADQARTMTMMQRAMREATE